MAKRKNKSTRAIKSKAKELKLTTNNDRPKKSNSEKRMVLKWTEESMIAAVAAVNTSEMSQRAACKAFKVPRGTLQSRLNGIIAMGARPGRPPKLSLEQEAKLVDYACNRAAMGIGFGKGQFLKYAGDFAKKREIEFLKGKPSHRWWSGVKKRHPNLSLRKPEGTAAIRHQCMDRTKVEKYFFALKDILDKHNLHNKEEQIWNMDETGIQLEHRPTKVLARTGSKHLQSRTSGNRETITIIGVINAAGGHTPPHIIVKGKTTRALAGYDMDSAPEGSTWSVSDSGWTKQGIALLWFTKSFLPNIGSERPQVLIVDGHDSHNFLELIDCAIANNIVIIELPAHTSHWLQPCDRTVFGPLKAHYNSACREMINLYPGVMVNHQNFAGLLKIAWDKALTTVNVKSGFRTCGIAPFNPSAIPVEAYMPSSLYTTSEGMAQHVSEESTIQSSSNVAIISSGTDRNNVVPAVSNEVPAAVTDATSSEAGLQLVINLCDFASSDASVVDRACQLIPPSVALETAEQTLTTEQLATFKYCFEHELNIDQHETFLVWKRLKLMTRPISNDIQSENKTTSSELSNHKDTTSSSTSKIQIDPVILNVPPQELILPDIATSSNTFPFQNRSFPGDEDNDVLPYPQITKAVKGSKTKKVKYFVITSQESRAAKALEIETRNKCEKEKLERQINRVKKAAERKEAMATKGKKALKNVAKTVSGAEKSNGTVRSTRTRLRHTTQSVTSQLMQMSDAVEPQVALLTPVAQSIENIPGKDVVVEPQVALPRRTTRPIERMADTLQTVEVDEMMVDTHSTSLVVDRTILETCQMNTLMNETAQAGTEKPRNEPMDTSHGMWRNTGGSSNDCLTNEASRNGNGEQRNGKSVNGGLVDEESTNGESSNGGSTNWGSNEASTNNVASSNNGESGNETVPAVGAEKSEKMISGTKRKRDTNRPVLKSLEKNRIKKPFNIRNMNTEKDTFCIFCDELFVEPPNEDWIECSKCKKWCHEECADTENIDKDNNFMCGVC